MGDGKGGFIAISRDIFNHPLFEQNQPFSRREAWEWLIAQAAWKPEARRGRYGVVHVERGQLASTYRELGKAWRWPKSNVARFLSKLSAETMIYLAKTALGTTTDTVPGTPTRYPVTFISISKYDVFQNKAAGRKSRLGQEAGQEAGQRSAEATESKDLFGAQQNKHSNHSLRAEAGERWSNRPKPAHGARNGKVIWFDWGTEEWHTYAEDFRQVTNSIVLPESRREGRGNWFVRLGESHRKRKRA